MEEQSERRKAIRHRTLKSAKIIFNNGRSTIDCLVRNQSEVDARLKIATVVGLPDQFELSIMGGPLRACRTIWHSSQELGVAYIAARDSLPDQT